jgi:uncharacterized protein (TIGR00369 family)
VTEPFTPPDPNFASRIRDSFAKQRVMEFIAATLARVEPGIIEIALPFRADLTQQNGFIHAGIITTIADSACGYAALSLMPPGTEVLSVEFKLNLLRPAAGERFVARAEVLKPGRTLTVTRADVFAMGADDERSLIAAMQATMISRPDAQR